MHTESAVCMEVVDMLRIAISCGEGFSSGYLAARLNELAEKEGIADRAHFIRIPVPELKDRQDEVDLAMVMPHMESRIRASGVEYDIPLYVIPFKAVTAVTAEDFIEDAEDILSLAKGRTGIFSFPDEKKTSLVSRLTSHRTWSLNHVHTNA